MKLINDDCMNIMQNYTDNYFDLAIVDPPYGINVFSTGNYKQKRNRWLNDSEKKITKWNKKPTKKYFNELFRISKNQIIFGGNYFNLPPYRCVIVWDKILNFESFSAVEIAWTSFNKPASLFKFSIALNNVKVKKLHPTQKPIALYRWILENYSKPTDKIIDTHLGSGSSAIASHYFGIKEFVGIEIDKEYYNNAVNRIKKETMQGKLL